MHNTPGSDKIIREEMSKVAIVCESEYNIFNTVSIAVKSAPRLVTVNIEVNNPTINMELDTGAALSLMAKDVYNSLKLPSLQPVKTGLATITGQRIRVLGTIS